MFDIEKWLPFLLAKSHQITFSLMKNAVEPMGLTPPQFATLAFLWKGDGVNQQHLGNLMNVDRTTIGGIIERLEKLGFITRDSAFDDRRSWVISVTAKGKSVEQEVLNSLEVVEKAIKLRLTQEEQIQLINLLNKLRKA